MAMACFRLVTFLPLRPLFNVPRFYLCMARSTSFEADFEYFCAIGLSDLQDTEPKGQKKLRHTGRSRNSGPGNKFQHTSSRTVLERVYG